MFRYLSLTDIAIYRTLSVSIFCFHNFLLGVYLFLEILNINLTFIERMSSYTFLRPGKDPLPPSLASTPVRYMVHNSFILGEKIMRPGVDYTSESGYQVNCIGVASKNDPTNVCMSFKVLRLATELVPATFAIMGSEQVSPFWAVLFYFILIMFGIAQQLAIWHCVITGIMAIKAKVLKSWETTITFFSCACGFILGLPMATEVGNEYICYNDLIWRYMTCYLLPAWYIRGIFLRLHDRRFLVVNYCNSFANSSSLHGARKTLQRRHGSDGSLFTKPSSMSLKLGSSFAIIYMERHFASCFNGK